MRITINIVRRDAAALSGVVRELNAVQKAAGGAGKQIANWGTRFSSVTKFGKDLQWTGRQLEYRFTLPLVLAGAAATKFALDNARAMAQLKKVYGSAGDDTNMLKGELVALEKAFTLLSGTFGVHKDEVIGIAADWAAAGAAGAGLAKMTRATLEAMIVGDMEAAEATTALITVTDSYKLSSEDLHKTLALLNQIENETAIRMSGLIDVIRLAGGAARTAGVDIRHLAAMAAALVPAAGTATEVGNMLKTTITSIMAPTGAAADAMAALGVQLDSQAWASSNLTERLETLAQGYSELTQNEKLQWARNVVNIRQISRLAVLLDDMVDVNGRYAKALKVSGDEAANLTRYNKELMDILTSDPRAFSAMINQIKNSMAAIILPLLPLILSVLDSFRQLIAKFTELSPKTQKIVLSMLALLAILGPIVAYTGSFAILLGTLGKWAYEAGRAIIFLATSPLTLWAIGIIAAAVLIWVFRDEIMAGLKSAAEGFWAFVQVVGRALVAVWKVITTIAVKIWEALQYLNPFARHSPSLVDNVRAGVATILDEYSKLRGIGGMLRDTMDDMEAFKRATDNINISGSSAARAKDREDLAGLGASPEALEIFDRLTGRMADLQAMLPTIQSEIDAQAIAVARWADELKRADAALEAAQANLDDLTDAASKARDELDAAKELLGELFNYSITGEAAASDALFANEMAIKALRLELLRLEESGQTIDQVTDQLANLSGEIEKLQAMEKDLRLAGAGSEITGPIRAQIASLEAQRRALAASGGSGSRSNEIQRQIDQLERQGEILELERSIKFDPLRRQLDLLRDGLNELPFDQLVVAILAQQAQVAILTERYDSATAAVEAQRTVVDGLNESRKAIQQTYDTEVDKLSALQEAYDAVARSMEDINSAVRGLTEGAAGGGDLGTPGDFEVPGGTGGNIAREGGLSEIEQLIKDWAAEQKTLFDKFDLLAGLKAKFKEFEEFFDGWRDRWDHGWEIAKNIVTNKWVQIGAAFAVGGIFAGAIVAILHFRDEIANAFDWVIHNPIARLVAAFVLIAGFGGVGLLIVALAAIWHFRDEIGAAWDWVVEKTAKFRAAFMESIQPLLDEVKKWGELWTPFKEATENVFNVIRTIVEFAMGVIVWHVKQAWEDIKVFLLPAFDLLKQIFESTFKVVWEIVKSHWDFIVELTKIVWNLIIGIVTGFLETLRGIINVILGLLTGDWSRVWDGITGIFGGVWTTMKAFWEAGKDLFTTLIPTALEGLRTVFTTIFREIFNIVKGIFNEMGDFIAGAVNRIIDVVNGLIGGINWVMNKLGIGKEIGKIGHVGGGSKQAWNEDPTLLAAGGITRGPMAIVGEGRRAYPEFVIPTDPRYRGNAQALLAQAMGAVGVPKMAPGGLVGGIGDAIGGIGDAIEDAAGAIRKAAAMAAFAPFLKAFDIGMGALPDGGVWDMLKGSADWMKNEVYNWVKGAAHGGIVPASPGGTLLRLGEKGYAEKIIPLGAGRNGGGDTFNFYGNLEFPNVQDGSDADEFLRNLKVVVS